MQHAMHMLCRVFTTIRYLQQLQGDTFQTVSQFEYSLAFIIHISDIRIICTPKMTNLTS